MTGGFNIEDDSEPAPESTTDGDVLPLVSVPEDSQAEAVQGQAGPPEQPAPQPQAVGAGIEQLAQMIASAVDSKLDGMMPEIRQTITEATLKFATSNANQQQQSAHAAQAQEAAAPPPEAAPAAGGSVSELIAMIPHLAQIFVEAKTVLTAGNISANPLGALKQIAEENPMLLSLYSPSPWGGHTQDMWLLSYKAGLQTKIDGMAAAGEMSKKAQADIHGYLVKGSPGSGGMPPERPSAPPVEPAAPPSSESIVSSMFGH